MTSSITTPGRWQFSILDLMAFTTMVALVLAWHRLFEDFPPVSNFVGYYPGLLGICSIALLLWACFLARSRGDVIAAWAMVVTGWLLAVFNYLLDTLNYCIAPLPCPYSTSQIQFNFNLILFRSVALPVFATLLVIYCFWGHWKYPLYLKSILNCSVLFGVVDMLILFYLLTSTFGIYRPYYRPYYPSNDKFCIAIQTISIRDS